MDPNETLRRLRQLCKDIEQQEGKWIDESAQNHAEAAIGEEIATLFEALDDWMSRGGFLPDAWHSQECVICGRDDVAKMEARCSRHKANN